MSFPLSFSWSEPWFLRAALVSFLCPFIWNLLARFIVRPLCADKSRRFQYTTCYLLAAWIFSFSSFRDYLFHLALGAQAASTFLSSPFFLLLGYALVVVGQVLVLSSMWVLGITGTYLGDYCGILMEARVTSFPFNVMDNPMYDGASMCFLGYALTHGSVAGVVLAACIFVIYRVALLFEGPYTAMIYEEAAKKKQQKKQ